MKSQHGSVLFELTLVLPLIVFIAIASIDIAQALRASKAAAVLSRELANIAFRECSVDVDECQMTFSADGIFIDLKRAAEMVKEGAKISATFWSSPTGCSEGSSIDYTVGADNISFPIYNKDTIEGICPGVWENTRGKPN